MSPKKDETYRNDLPNADVPANSTGATQVIEKRDAEAYLKYANKKKEELLEEIQTLKDRTQQT